MAAMFGSLRAAALSLFAIALAACALFAVAAMLAAPPASAAPGAAPKKVVVIDDGDWVTVEAHQATLDEVLKAMAAELRITFGNTERLDLGRIVDGRRAGSIIHVMEWIVPAGGFIVLYREPKLGDAGPRRIRAIAFLQPGTRQPF